MPGRCGEPWVKRVDMNLQQKYVLLASFCWQVPVQHWPSQKAVLPTGPATSRTYVSQLRVVSKRCLHNTQQL